MAYPDKDWTREEMEKAIIECVNQDDGFRAFGSDWAAITAFLNRYNVEYRKAHVDEDGQAI